MKKIIQISVQTLFLIVFVVLMISGKIQIWMALLVLSLLLTPHFGRFYCGWICPIHPAMSVTGTLRERLGMKARAVPAPVRHPAVRGALLLMFLGFLGMSMVTGRHVPVLPLMVAAGALLTLFFRDALWHRYLCPFGTLLRLAAFRPGKTLRVHGSQCVSCGQCRKVCPSEAVIVTDKTYTIDARECLLCNRCSRRCRPGAIRYGGGIDAGCFKR